MPVINDTPTVAGVTMEQSYGSSWFAFIDPCWKVVMLPGAVVRGRVVVEDLWLVFLTDADHMPLSNDAAFSGSVPVEAVEAWLAEQLAAATR